MGGECTGKACIKPTDWMNPPHEGPQKGVMITHMTCHAAKYGGLHERKTTETNVLRVCAMVACQH